MQQKKNLLTKDDLARYTIRFWKIVIGCLAFAIILLFSIGLGLFGKLPSASELEHPKSNQASEVLSADGGSLGTYFAQNRTSVNYDQISPNVINALVATEDKRFYDHSGIDFRRNITSPLYLLIGKKQGGSTITQQLALNMFSKEGRSKDVAKRIIQKLQEWILAVKLERNYTKEEIITMYLNTVDFGAYNVFGIKQASLTYFNVLPDKLEPQQAALLMGMLKGPTQYSPINYPEKALARRNLLLENMHDSGYLSDAQATELKQTPLGLKFKPAESKVGHAAYFRAVLKKDIQRIFEEQSIQKADGTPYDLDRDGLKIYTTIDSKMQDYAESAQSEYLKSLQHQFNRQWGRRDPFKNDKTLQMLLDQGMQRSDRYQQLKLEGKSEEDIRANFNQAAKMKIFSWRGDIDTLMRPIDSVKYYKLLLRNAVMSMEPKTGYVKAWVGGDSFEYFKYDQVKTGTRQVGSTAKPFTYAVAINNGISPCLQVPNEPVTITEYGQSWTPNAYKPIPGYLTLTRALANSQNYITAYVMKEVGATAVATQIKKLGITSPVQAVPSICLGTFDASLYDMVGAYSTFVNHGVWREPTYLLRIEDKNGIIIYDHKPKAPSVALNPQTAYVMTQMLKQVVIQGTAMRLRGPRYRILNPVGGKTGTTQNNSDGWFIGITPELVTGVWTGCEDRAIHFASTDDGEGANSALPVFALFMKKVYADKSLRYSKGDFEPPAGGVNITLDCSAYGPAKRDTSQTPAETGIQ